MEKVEFVRNGLTKLIDEYKGRWPGPYLDRSTSGFLTQVLGDALYDVEHSEGETDGDPSTAA